MGPPLARLGGTILRSDCGVHCHVQLDGVLSTRALWEAACSGWLTQWLSALRNPGQMALRTRGFFSGRQAAGPTDRPYRASSRSWRGPHPYSLQGFAHSALAPRPVHRRPTPSGSCSAGNEWRKMSSERKGPNLAVFIFLRRENDENEGVFPPSFGRAGEPWILCGSWQRHS